MDIITFVMFVNLKPRDTERSKDQLEVGDPLKTAFPYGRSEKTADGLRCASPRMHGASRQRPFWILRTPTRPFAASAKHRIDPGPPTYDFFRYQPPELASIMNHVALPGTSQE